METKRFKIVVTGQNGESISNVVELTSKESEEIEKEIIEEVKNERVILSQRGNVAEIKFNASSCIVTIIKL